MPNLEDMIAEPEPPDDNDPELQEEAFKIHKSMGAKPEDLNGRITELRAKYAAWLESKKGLNKRG